MKKLVIFLFITLGVVVNIFSQQYEYTETSEKRMIITSDKAKIFILDILTLKENIFLNGICVATKITCDSSISFTYNIESGARRFINDSVATVLLGGEVVNVKDSMLRRGTHLYGMEIYLKRQLVPENNNVFLNHYDPYRGPALFKVFFRIWIAFSIVFFLFLIFLNYKNIISRESLQKIFLLAFVFLFFIFLIFLSQKEEQYYRYQVFLDALILSLFPTFPILIHSLFPLGDKR